MKRCTWCSAAITVWRELRWGDTARVICGSGGGARAAGAEEGVGGEETMRCIGRIRRSAGFWPKAANLGKALVACGAAGGAWLRALLMRAPVACRLAKGLEARGLERRKESAARRREQRGMAVDT
ncbi:hypothetical protein E2562_035391 [Oryza meyeriana var. granulata]|uniref:Uncharacterized protein n=1 Tax=Oryza meyeriana var. granulata TaxID=110450 RepID=A0A6G1E6V1_9ORYZ|nr:hypothetical protein E2562_035391 [Oryza meyeriana var. granulata]